ncbi:MULTISPECIES: DUF411 domain-containing protein [Hydrogenophilus]|jgi:hypothetical protein|uniref:Metal-binding protein n=1 Tax=Hydrogenophilus thermoluteolus TaxID=297 RepID=A0A2Z6E0M3_HYDTE|nr:metal-binding protein [Hydrogenophilus thermoluteolus]
MGLALSFLATSSFASGKEFAEESPLVKVWKSPYCGCCKEWIAHMQANGFQVQTFEVGNSEVRSRLGMPMRYGSCHTAVVQGYVIEGHVPAADVKRLLAEKPNALGLAVPGMVIGSPGMDGPAYEGRKDPYDVLLIQRNGEAEVYHAYR